MKETQEEAGGLGSKVVGTIVDYLKVPARVIGVAFELVMVGRIMNGMMVLWPHEDRADE